MKSSKELHIKFDAPLGTKDTESQTFGCRANNPSICKNAYMEDICAFCTADNICRKPSSAWRKQYNKLIRQEEK